MTRISYIYWILPFYDYAYESTKIIRWLWKETRDLWKANQEIILKMFKKQTIHIGERNIDENTIKVLKRGERYKWFKLDIWIKNTIQSRVKLIYKMLKEIPDFEVCQISIKQGNNGVIRTLKQLPMFKEEKDLFEVLDF